MADPSTSAQEQPDQRDLEAGAAALLFGGSGGGDPQGRENGGGYEAWLRSRGRGITTRLILPADTGAPLGSRVVVTMLFRSRREVVVLPIRRWRCRRKPLSLFMSSAVTKARPPVPVM